MDHPVLIVNTSIGSRPSRRAYTTSTKRLRVHPKFKIKYHVSNWPDYDRSLVERGSITLWLSEDALAAWNPTPSRKRGGQPRYSNLAIETALTLRLLLHLPLRQTEGFLRSIFDLLRLSLDAPDHTTLSRRSQDISVSLRSKPRTGSIDLVLDSRGLAIFGQGQWAAAKHGEKGIQGWRKLHLGVDETGVIVAQELTDANTDDATTGVNLINQAPGSRQSSGPAPVWWTRS